ncbi:YadA-like family protein [Stenotrophomonas maltophilia]|uniref:ESPR-type extended signal peptide-containing protein n=1 Tax=Stenotrophomonas TaxID=40323 RepID=UPI000DAA99FF|nr:ESPR-type extended signal peptide-containing protein [Stenotrophomonas sp. PAMC25021]MBH1510411.1 YadA-like family protein [Stenotrophomonas maltophilia]MBH1546908.1 YadA-like family protein [Stenotrophomonas maltophilia]MBH1862314.1 YadA-like family protein [Stenotrophomonas maltophilia]MBN5063248.1 YadA-like family protein [Stenotrophomonas maltophilia]MCU1035459.1 YadA-like family protein [Stenotrophomonas maltophilia]
MNHIYRRIWSTAKQCWVVGSELSALRGKPHGGGARLSGNCAVLAACFFFLPLAQAMEPAHCESEQTECAPDASATNTVRMNSLLKATDDLSRAGLLAVGETIWGDGIKRNGDHNTAFGYRVEVTGGYNTAVGSNARAHGLGSTALGNNSWGSGVNSVAVGSGAQVTTNGGVGAIAIGADARAGTSGVSGAVSIGHQAVARYDGVALGYRANALAYNSVALGNGSTAYEDNIVSVGSSSNKRRIVNVARGSTSYGSTDAVTGGQLYETNQTVSAIGSVAGTANSNANTALSTANTAKSTADNALLRANALTGLLNQTSASGNVRLGASNSGTVLDVRNSANASRKITGVADATLSTTSAEAVSGKQLNATNTNVAAARSVADSAKTNADSALAKANVISGLLSQTSASGNVRLGASNSGTVLDVRNSANASRKITGVADATLSTTSTEAVSGKQLNATNTNVTAARSVADSAKSNADSALAKANVLSGLLSQTSASGNVRVGASNSGTVLDVRNSASASRTITGVADATLSTTSTDAVSGKQLNATNTKVEDAQRAADAAIARLNASAPAIGLAAEAEGSGSTASVAMGRSAKAYNTNSIAVGADARASVDANGDKSAATGAVALGAATRSGNGAVAAGLRASAVGDRAVAVGNDATAAATHAAALGYKADASGNQAVAIGREAAASGLYSTALGNLAKAGAESAIALGDRALASHTGSVALGNGSQTTGINQVSVGSSSIKRKIVNLADGAVSSSSTEAITGKQLNETNGRVTTAQNAANGAQTTANAAQVDATKALAEVTVLGGLVGQVSATGIVRLGEKNSGTVLDVRNIANVNRKLTGVANGAISASSYEAVNGRQLNATNEKVVAVEGMATSAAADATLAKVDAAKALAETAVLGGLVAQVSASGDVRLGEKNSGTTLNVRNSANADRKISGVADGGVDASSSEAVSGRQLYTTNNRISDLENANLYVSVGTDSFSERADAASLGVAIGDSAKAGAEGATALGAFARALSKNSVAVGRGAGVSGGAADGFAMGAGAQVHAISGVAIGAGAVVEGSAAGSLALGADSGADEAGTASFGNATTQRRLTNIARGTADHNATTVSQLNDSLATLGGGAGMDANGNIIAPTYAVQSGTQGTVEDALMALDGAVVTAGRRADKVEGRLGSIFQDSPSTRADGMSQIVLNGVNGMVLTNLADGRVAPGSRDAVTGSQLYAAEQKISQNRNDLEAMRKEREVGEQAMRGLDASGPIDFGGARLTGVSDGSVSADSHDVVTGRQLFGVSDRVSKIEHQGRFLKIDTDQLSEDAFAGFLGVAIGDSARTQGEGGTAVGSFASSLGVNSVAIGRGSSVSANSLNGFAVGAGAHVASTNGVSIGVSSRVHAGAEGSLALGVGSEATEAGTASFGSAGTERRLVNIANGTANHNAATVGQLRGALSALGSEVDANGNIVGPSFNVQGQSQSTLNGALEALDGAVVSTTSRVNQVESQLRSVFQETPSVRADGTHQLTLAGANGMVISNVANGLIAAGSRDAVNGGQLHSMQQQINGRMDGLEQRIDGQPQARATAAASTPSPSTEETAPAPETGGSPQIASTGEGDKPAPQPKSKQDDTPKPQVDTAELEKMLARANEYTDGAISNFERRLDKMDKRFNRMAAMSSAQSAMAMNTAGLATYNRLGAGVGYSEGESAMAVGYQRVLNEKGSATFSLNGAFTNSGERSMGVGVGIGW